MGRGRAFEKVARMVNTFRCTKGNWNLVHVQYVDVICRNFVIAQ